MTPDRLSLGQILEAWAQGDPPQPEAWQQLAQWELADDRACNAFGISAANVEERLSARSQLFESVVKLLDRFPLHSENRLKLLWQLWLPLAMHLAARRDKLARPLIQGILGAQGTGKTTLTKILKLILAEMGYEAIGISIDDLYKTYRDRQQLKARDPRLAWRGPPGTHDIELGIEVLDRLRHPDGKPIPIPRFDKSAWDGEGDRSEPEVIQNADIAFFEGWFVGVRPVDPSVFDLAPNPIRTPCDRRFARDVNQRLRDYLPLWQRLDGLIVLYPQDYRSSLQWRMQAEREMKAQGKSGMSDAQIEEFVKYFWRALHPELFITPLVQNPQWVDFAIEIAPDRAIAAIYRPSEG